MSEGAARYFFLPWLRRGLGASIRQEPEGARATLGVRLQVGGCNANSEGDDECPTKPIALYGPGDVLGFDSRIIVRTEPRPNTGDFEHNYFPFIEFAEPDFPWRFTALGKPSGDASDLKPWIALIVLRTQEIQEKDGTPKPNELVKEGRYPESQIPWIRVKVSNLPDLNGSGRWAHVQITGHQSEFADKRVDDRKRLSSILEREPERAVARLLCARRLRAGVKYTAYVVPTFRLGKDAASTGRSAVGAALTPAWSQDGDVAGESADDAHIQDVVELPYYYKWEFRTGRRGDFEHLVRRLEPRELSGLGLRDADCSAPGYCATGPEEALGFESALKSIDTEYTSWGRDSSDRSAPGKEFGEVLASDKSTPDKEFREVLANLLNLADGYLSSADGESGDDDPDPTPKVVPPLYGCWQKAQARVDQNGDDWFAELNLDPRHRWAAGLGAEIVRKQQEQLMASAWDQLGDIVAVNDILRRAQFAREVSTQAEARLNQLSSGDYLRTTASVLGLVQSKKDDGASVEKQIHESPIGKAPLDPALRRLGRKRGALRKHQVRLNEKIKPDGKKKADLLVRLNPPELNKAPMTVVRKTIPARGVPSLKRITDRITREPVYRVRSAPPQKLRAATYTAAAKSSGTSSNTKVIFGETQVAAALSGDGNIEIRPEKGREYEATADAVRAAFDGWLNPSRPVLQDPERIKNFNEVPASVKAQLKPAKTIGERVQGRLRHLAVVPRPADSGESAGASAADEPSLDLIQVAPEFPQPMWDALEELSQHYLLAGIDKIPQNTVALLEPNRRFVEAFLCGLNHEFSRELLWREYPTDQRGTYFRQFWGKTGYLSGAWEVDARRSYEALVGYSYWSPEDKQHFAEIYCDQLGDTEGWDEDKVLDELMNKKAVEEWRKDIPPLESWEAPLGKNYPAALEKFAQAAREDSRDSEAVKGDDSLVLLIRGDLLNKYPNAAIYLLKGNLLDTGETIEVSERRHPVFAVTAKPDIACIGFDLTAEAAIDDEWYLVLEERISETRFGLDESGGDTASDLSWQHFDAAEDEYLNSKSPSSGAPLGSASRVALSTMQKPVRVIISAKRMIPPVRLCGRIQTREGQAISGATVTVGGKSAETNHQGDFSFDRLQVGTQTLTAQHSDYEQRQENVVLYARGTNDVLLELTPLPGMIGGTVTDHLGKGVGGVNVSYPAGKETTTSSGNYEFTDVPVGRYWVTAEYGGFRTENREVNVESKKRAEASFALTPTTGTIEGKVTDHIGNALADTLISAGGKRTRSMGADGVYELTGVPVGKHTISVEHIGFQTQQRPVSVEGGKSTSSPFSLIPTTGTISGSIKGAKNVPLTGVAVYAGGRKIKTQKGQFVLTGVPVGNVAVTLTHPSYVRRILQLKLNGGETKVINETLILLPGSVKGTVKSLSLQRGKTHLSSVRGAEVTLGTRSARTDGLGVFRFGDVPAGSYKINVKHPGCKAIDAPKDVVVLGGGQTESSVNLTLKCYVPEPTPPPRPQDRKWRPR